MEIEMGCLFVFCFSFFLLGLSLFRGMGLIGERVGELSAMG